MCQPAAPVFSPPSSGGPAASGNPVSRGAPPVPRSTGNPSTPSNPAYNPGDLSTWGDTDWARHYRGQGLSEAQVAARMNASRTGFDEQYQRRAALRAGQSPTPTTTPAPTPTPTPAAPPTPAPPSAPAPTGPLMPPIYTDPSRLPTAPLLPPVDTAPSRPPPLLPPVDTVTPRPKSLPTQGAQGAGNGVYRVSSEYAPGNAAGNVTDALMRRYRRNGWN